MRIDETGILKLKGSTDTDHNTITAEIHITDIEIPPKPKTVVWRLNAPEENWKKFDHELKKLEVKAYQWFQTVENDINPAYKKLMKGIDAAARISLGKTTLKNRRGKYSSNEIKQLRQKKKRDATKIKNKHK